MPPLERCDDFESDFVKPAPVGSTDQPMEESGTGRIRFDTEESDQTQNTENTEKYDGNYDYEREQELLRLHREAKDHREFPDEVDTPIDGKTRFQKFRGLGKCIV